MTRLIGDRCVAHVSIAGKHAMRCENLREYCTNPACSHRPDEYCHENQEFNTDDTEDMVMQADNFEPGEREMPNDMDEIVAASGGSVHAHGNAKPIRLYNWSAPQQWWSALMQEVCEVGEACKVGFVFSRTAHPGAIVAMRSLWMRVYSLKCGVSVHCQVHGDLVMDRMLLANAVEKARCLTPSTGEA